MKVFEAIRNRRSIRKYLDKNIPDDIVDKLLEAAMYAPSARNERSWHFIVINKRELLDEITKVHPYSSMLKQAPLAILVCGDTSIEPSVEYNAINCSAATQNILLAAYEMGLGTCWLGVFPRQDRVAGLTKLFNLPGNIIPISLVAVGYPDETKETPERFMKDRVRYNSW